MELNPALLVREMQRVQALITEKEKRLQEVLDQKLQLVCQQIQAREEEIEWLLEELGLSCSTSEASLSPLEDGSGEEDEVTPFPLLPPTPAFHDSDLVVTLGSLEVLPCRQAYSLKPPPAAIHNPVSGLPVGKHLFSHWAGGLEELDGYAATWTPGYGPWIPSRQGG
jgi:hypothetical protein